MLRRFELGLDTYSHRCRDAGISVADIGWHRNVYLDGHGEFKSGNYVVDQPGGGKHLDTGLYTAPSSVTAIQTVTVVATSAADKTVSASATVLLALPTPDRGTLCSIDDTYQFTMKNASSGLTLGIAGQRQAASAADHDHDGGLPSAQGPQWDGHLCPRPLHAEGHDPYQRAVWNHQTIAYSTDLMKFTYTTLTTPKGACTAVEGTGWITAANHCPIIASRIGGEEGSFIYSWVVNGTEQGSSICVD